MWVEYFCQRWLILFIPLRSEDEYRFCCAIGRYCRLIWLRSAMPQSLTRSHGRDFNFEFYCRLTSRTPWRLELTSEDAWYFMGAFCWNMGARNIEEEMITKISHTFHLPEQEFLAFLPLVSRAPIAVNTCFDPFQNTVLSNPPRLAFLMKKSLRAMFVKFFMHNFCRFSDLNCGPYETTCISL